MHVTVLDNDVEKALRRLKRQMRKEGYWTEVKKRRHHLKPSEKKRDQKRRSIQRLRKRNQLIRG
jgi:small subunit ribosomal protein S21